MWLRNMWSVITIGCVMYLSNLVQANDLPQVTIAQGTVVGSRASDGDYFEFHGIPYADSTSGRNRFKAPSAPPSFKDVFIANRKDVKCVRALGVGYEGTEDCLVANIFTPRINTTELLPVMVWIKGREFDKIFKPRLSFKNFMAEDVIVVSLNYRESILGFLCLGTETAPGNAGLKDIIAGLEWVRKNIAQFGGDPENISLFGHGSGAAAVDLISLSPMSEGLIQKVITQSGTALAPWAVTRDNIKFAVDVAEALGHEIINVEQLSEIFTRTSVAALMAVINELDLTDNSLAFAPCLEKETLEDSVPFLLKSPHEILTNGEYTSLPFMAGFVDKEGTIRAEEALEGDWLEKMDESFIDFIQPDLSFESTADELAVIDKIKYFYFNSESIDASKMEEYLTYIGDTMILVSTLREAKMRATSSNGTIYLYQFSYKGSLGEAFVGPLPIDEAAHSEDLAYLFRDVNNTVANDMDITVSDILIERWTSFAKTGVPESETSKIQWQPYTRDNSYYLRILDDDEVNRDMGGTLEMALENPHPETLSFWDHIYEDHFKDARGRWNIIDREEGEGSGEEEGSGDEDEGNGGEDGGNGGEDGGNGGEDGGNGGEDGGNGGEDGGNGGEDGGNGGEDGGNGGEDGGGGDDNPSPPDEEGGEGEDDGDNSAPAVVGYTFLIMSVFAVLEKICLS